MKFDVSKDSSTLLNVKVSIDNKTVDAVVNLIYLILNKNKTIDKYRKGNAPVEVLKMHYPFNFIEEDLKRELSTMALLEFKKQYQKQYGVLDHTLKLIDIKVNEDEDAFVNFTAEVFVAKKPKISLNLPGVDGKTISMYIEKLKESYSKLEDIDTQENLQKGDYCFLNLGNKNYSEVITYRYGKDKFLTNLDEVILKTPKHKRFEEVENLKLLEKKELNLKISLKISKMIKTGKFFFEIVNLQRKVLPTNEEFLEMIGFHGGYEEYEKHIAELINRDNLEKDFLSTLYMEIGKNSKNDPIPETIIKTRENIVESVFTHIKESYKDILDREDFASLIDCMRPLLFGYSLTRDKIIKLLQAKNSLTKTVKEKLVKESSILFSAIKAYKAELLEEKNQQDTAKEQMNELKLQMQENNLNFDEWQQSIVHNKDNQLSKEIVNDLLNQISYMLDVDMVMTKLLEAVDGVNDTSHLIKIYRKKAGITKKVLHMLN